MLGITSLIGMQQRKHQYLPLPHLHVSSAYLVPARTASYVITLPVMHRVMAQSQVRLKTCSIHFLFILYSIVLLVF